MSLQGHPPLHPATQNGSSSQAQAEELMDQFMFAEMTPPPAASSASQQGASASGGVSRPGGLSNLHPILTSNLRGPAHVPSSPVSPMLSSLDMLAGGASMASPRQVASNKAFLSAVSATGAPQQNAAKEPAVALTRAVSDEDAAMEQRAEQEAEMMSREEEEEAMAAAAAAASGEDHLAGGPLTAEEEEMLRQEEEGDESDWLEEEESEEAPPATAGESAQLSREEQQALEEKTKQRKKAAEMRYLVNSMYRYETALFSSFCFC